LGGGGGEDIRVETTEGIPSALGRVGVVMVEERERLAGQKSSELQQLHMGESRHDDDAGVKNDDTDEEKGSRG
jgi:hypothetical protein